MSVLIFFMFLVSLASPVREWVIDVESSPIHRLQGEVKFHDDPLPDVSIEVYDNGEVILQRDMTFEEMRSRQRLVATTTTDDKGRFKVKRLPPGQYELHFEGEGWNPLSVIVTVVPGKQKVEKKKLAISMPLGG